MNKCNGIMVKCSNGHSDWCNGCFNSCPECHTPQTDSLQENDWEMFKKEVIKGENITNIEIDDTRKDGLIMGKKLLCKKGDYALFLHEIAHYLTKEWNGKMGDKTGHHSIWGDKLTELIRKYMVPKSHRQDILEEIRGMKTCDCDEGSSCDLCTRSIGTKNKFINDLLKELK